MEDERGQQGVQGGDAAVVGVTIFAKTAMYRKPKMGSDVSALLRITAAFDTRA